MNLKKAPVSRPVSLLISRVLKTAGIIVTLAALLDMIVMPMPYQFLDRQWQIQFATGVVDRGVVPLVGIVLFLLGFWIDSSTGTATERKRIWQDPRFWTFILASLLGLFFLLLFPFHLNNVRLGQQDAMEKVNQQVASTQTELNTRLQTEVASQRQQINQLISASDEQIDQLVKNGQLTKDQADLVRKFKADPKSVEPFIKQRQGELQNQLQTEIGTRQAQAQQSTKTEALKSGLRVSISSLLLAIGFIVIGWTGLRNLGQM